MHLMRTRFKNDIVAEFLPPDNPSNKAIIFCDGLPTVPSKKNILNFWAKRGYLAIHPRYRGTWESGGEFLADTPDKDILDIVEDLKENKKIISLWNDQEYTFDLKEVYIIGSSFGGATALLASRNPLIKKVVCISPAVDWLAPSEEDIGELYGFIRKAFGEAYRFSADGWEKLKSGHFFNPVNHAAEIDGKKVMIIHAEDDKIVRLKEVKEFAEKINCWFVYLKKGGHMSASISTQLRFYWKIKKFLKNNEPTH